MTESFEDFIDNWDSLPIETPKKWPIERKGAYLDGFVGCNEEFKKALGEWAWRELKESHEIEPFLIKKDRQAIPLEMATCYCIADAILGEKEIEKRMKALK